MNAAGGDLVAVTGATGFVGQAVLMAAGRHKLDVRALTRRKQRLRGGVEWIDGDLASKDALERLMEGASAVIHIAGVVNAPDAAGFEEGNVQGTLRVIEAAHEMGVGRLIHVSSLAAREPQLSLYGASKLRGEKLVRASGLDWTVVRPPAVFGPRDTEMLELFRLARRGFVPLPPPGRLSVIHVADLAELLLALLPSSEESTHQIFEPDDGEPGGWSHIQLAHAIGAAVRERPIRPLSLSPRLVELAARADRLLRGKKAKLTPDRARYICHPDWTVGEGAQPPRSLWHPRIDTREGLHATAAWYREAGWLR
ncbi:NAD-dependent epimerase/dehydratase family protein [Novosphingobium sp.]|uniref:NAD-dependent epimerase/dehydratase family protein n=1 Tax=Novosphingobium sp. TaxID=1874826 RepID=UPI00260E8701|nr:NAD-dependent epimerase/dehydratase family protein [Novosphingobium sp.]